MAVGPVAGHEQIVIVLENDLQRLARALLVIHDQQRAAPLGGGAGGSPGRRLVRGWQRSRHDRFNRHQVFVLPTAISTPAASYNNRSCPTSRKRTRNRRAGAAKNLVVGRMDVVKPLRQAMSEFKFTCPVCGQHIAADSTASGAQIECPTCFQKIIIPQAPRADSRYILSATQYIKPPPVTPSPAPAGRQEFFPQRVSAGDRCSGGFCLRPPRR